MTDKQTEALKLALEALNELIPDVHDWYGAKVHRANAAITAIREALAQSRSDVEQQAAEPVLVRDLAEILGVTVHEVCHELEECGGPRRSANMAVSGVEALAVAAQLKQAAEPVAWANPNDLQNFDMKVRTNGGPLHTVPLYTAPPANANAGKPWVGLTDEDIGRCFDAADGTRVSLIAAIEAKLKEKNA